MAEMSDQTRLYHMLREGVDLMEGPVWLPRPRDIEMEKADWAQRARELLAELY